MKISEIITESGEQHLSQQEAIQKLKTDFSDAYEEARQGNVIYKGFGDKRVVYDILPPLRGRTSQNTNNFYTLIMNNDPKFSHLPKRSVIASRSRLIASSYTTSDASLGMVFPKNGTKIGVVPERDIWRTPLKGDMGYNMGYFEWGKMLERIVTKISSGFVVKSYNDLMRLHEYFMDHIKDESNYDEMVALIMHKLKMYHVPEATDVAEKIMDQGLEYIFDMLDPSVFNVIDVKNIGSVNDKSEIWFDDEFLVINIQFINDFLQ